MPEIEDDKSRINLSLRDTEHGWTLRWDKFVTAVTPEWFNILGWVALLAGLQLINAKHGHWLFKVVIAVSLFLMWQYFTAALCRIEFVLPARFRRVQVLVSIIIAYALAYGCYRLAQFAVFLIADSTP